METLSIDNFLTIKKAKIQLKRVNIFIGPQGQGKSIVSKLIYFFKEIPLNLIDSALEQDDLRETKRKLTSSFFKIFPKSYWEKTKFSITYETNHHTIHVTNLVLASKKNRFDLELSSTIKDGLRLARQQAKKELSQINEKSISNYNRYKSQENAKKNIAKRIFQTAENPRLEEVMYIPAGRAFFSTLQKNIFLFLSTSNSLDHFLTEFGSIFERTKAPYTYDKLLSKTPKEVIALSEKLIRGKFHKEKGNEWIVGSNGKVLLSQASSGQQEALPLALILSTWPYVRSENVINTFIIEEPEAHLFPASQNTVISLISRAYNQGKGDSSYIITTHSPYIISVINTMIQAGNAMINNDAKRDKISEIMPPEEHLIFSEVSAYVINNGKIEDILDYENNLINASPIDEISSHISATYDALLEIEFEE